MSQISNESRKYTHMKALTLSGIAAGVHIIYIYMILLSTFQHTKVAFLFTLMQTD